MKFLDVLEEVLKSDERFVGENNQVIKTKVADAARGTDELLIKSLLQNKLLRDNFFTKVDDIYVFDKVKFIWVLESKEFLPDSYTLYKNKIGLVDSQNNLISQKQDVSLVWPYKDCVLEGGQTKEDQKREEIFYNETLAPDEVNRLLAPKVLSNAKRYTVGGVKENIYFRDKDNLIIKGNNLLGLSSLLKRYEGKIKCIYIDPPYYFHEATATDTFKYNSNFSLSTWLVFMKNRLELAQKLLKTEGTIWIQINEDGMHYLKVLADDIFGKDCFVGTLPRRTRDGKSDVPYNFSQDFDWILIYSNVDSKHRVLGRTVERDYYETSDYPGRPWRLADLTSQQPASKRPNSYFTMVNPKNGDEYPASKKRTWAVTKDTFPEYYDNGYIVFPGDYDFLNIGKPYSRKFKDEDDQAGKLSSVISDFLIQDFLKELLTRSKNKSGNDEIDELFGREEFDYAKPENLIKSIIEVCTNEGDIVLDFFMGSATTQAVAHKLKRQYIGIEQMDYIEDVSVQRLKKVIDGEQGGVSEEVDWQGGGSFVYCELLVDNQSLINEVQEALNSSTIISILNRATDNGKIVPSVLPDDLKKTEEEFDELSLEEQKTLVLELLDKNKLYVNLSDLDDEDANVSEADKAFTKSFYGLD